MASDLQTLRTVVAIAVADGLLQPVTGGNAITVLAPNQNAFAAIPTALFERLQQPRWGAHLRSILAMHVTRADGFLSTMLTDGMMVPTVNPDESLTVNTNGGVTFEGRVNQAQVVRANLGANDGIVHVIDTVLLPLAMTQDLVQVATAQNFTTFLSLAQQAGGIASILGNASLITTVLVPNDAALANVQVPTNPFDLQAILRAHLLPGVYPSQILTDGATIATGLSGKSVTVGANATSVTFDGANVVQANIIASNGLIHVIDQVLSTS